MKTALKYWLLVVNLQVILISVALTSAQDTSEATRPEIEIVYDNRGAAMVAVPASTFEMGYTFEHVLDLCEELRPPNAPPGSICNTDYLNTYVLTPETMEVSQFYLDLYEVSMRAYIACVEADVCEWRPLRNLPPEPTDVPMRAVSYYDAAIFCAWREARLPTEVEWEYAARGPDSLEFPWGNEFEGTRVNFCDTNCTIGHNFISAQWDDGYEDVAPIDSYGDGASWIGIYNLAGNVAEWTSTPIQLSGEASRFELRIIKGGSFRSYPYQTTGWTRYWDGPEEGGQSTVGFRCARTTPPSSVA